MTRPTTPMMSDPSSFAPIIKWSEEWWARAKPEVRARRCKAHKKSGIRCAKPAMNGQRVCGTHGGRAKHSVEAARRRMMEYADPAVKKLTEIAFDPTKSDEIRLKATLAIIDRAGLSPRQALEIEVGPAKPYEQIADGMIEMQRGGSRAEHRRAMGIPDDTPALAAPTHNEPIEAQVIDDFDDADMGNLSDCAQPITPGDDERVSVFDTAPARDGLMTMEDGVGEIARLRREGCRAHAPGATGVTTR